MSTRHRQSLLYYWSLRYFIVLLLSMAVVSAAMLFVIDQDARSTQIRKMQNVARDIAGKAASFDGQAPDSLEWVRFLDETLMKHDISDRPIVIIYDRNGAPVHQHPTGRLYIPDSIPGEFPELRAGDVAIFEKVKPFEDDDLYFAAATPIVSGERISGHVLYVMQENKVLQGVLAFQPPRLILITTGILSGWAVIYWLTRHLVRPIQEVGAAAKQIVSGQYDIRLSSDHQTREIDELQASFREMTERLKQLESLRTQLLAGVTHELKTPVTSISGLVQAVRSGVVSGEEAQAFLDYCLKETGRLQSMIGDLLDFNSFAAGAVSVEIKRVNLKDTVHAAIEKWRVGQERTDLAIDEICEEENADWTVRTDPIRLEQIIVNLLNNAAAALEADGRIQVNLTANTSRFRIEVRDNGRGIPPEEQDQVFVPFFRGKDKMTSVRGLGLGLPFSRLMARSMGGDLKLVESGPGGTAVALTLPRSGKSKT